MCASCSTGRPSNPGNSISYLSIFALAVLAVTSAFSVSQLFWISGSIRASRTMHATLAKSILGTTFRFLDKTPIGRIIQRFTQDISSVDGNLSLQLGNVIQLSAQLIQKVVVIVTVTPAFLVPGLVLGIVGGIVTRIYIKVSSLWSTGSLFDISF